MLVFSNTLENCVYMFENIFESYRMILNTPHAIPGAKKCAQYPQQNMQQKRYGCSSRELCVFDFVDFAIIEFICEWIEKMLSLHSRIENGELYMGESIFFLLIALNLLTINKTEFSIRKQITVIFFFQMHT